MRKIIIPPAVDVRSKAQIEVADGKPAEKNQVMDLKEFAILAIESHKTFGTGIRNIRMGAALHKLFDNLKDDATEVGIAEPEFTALKKACDEMVWNPQVSRHLVTFYDALDASK